MSRIVGIFGAAWAAVGVCGLLVLAISRLFPRARAAYELGLSPLQWLLTLVLLVGMAYSEGYLGFQKRFSPRTAARVRYLRDHPHGLRALLAPLFAMGFFQATRRTLIRSYALTAMIVLFIVAVHRLDQPWRGMIDAGVVLGLGWGVVSLVASIVLALTRDQFDVSPEVPQP